MTLYAIASSDAPDAGEMKKDGYSDSMIRVAFNRVVHDLDQLLKTINETHSKHKGKIEIVDSNWISGTVIINTEPEVARDLLDMPGIGAVFEAEFLDFECGPADGPSSPKP